MARLNTYLLAAATLSIALGTGYVMQRSTTVGPARGAEPLTLAAITDTSSAAALPRLPSEAAMMRLPAPASASPDMALPAPQTAQAPDCPVTLTADVAAGAMMALTLEAPCHREERLTLHHQGLMLTEVTDAEGRLSLELPALAEQALVIAAFDSGRGATTQIEVPSLAFYDRVVLQWKGDSGLHLHAREFGSGHVWAASAGDLTRTAAGEGGFLTLLGARDTPDALQAEVYTFPRAAARVSGTINLSIEAEVTAANCAQRVEALTLDLRSGKAPHAADLSLEMPDCESTGDFLVLKNLIEDLKIAAN